MIAGPPNDLRVELRRKLAGQDQVEAFKTALGKKIDEARSAANGKHPAMSFRDFDISQNKIPVEDLCDIFMILSQSDIRVVRLRLFGCPTMNDEAAMVLSNWFAAVTAETAPFELHLSDCALTTIGFLGLTGAIRDNPAFPPLDPVSGKPGPMYLRIENNYIDPETMQDIISEGTCCTFTKKNWGWGSWGQAHYDGAVPETTKIKLLTGEDHVSRQKTGEPPPLEQAPAYKNVIDWRTDPDGLACKGKGKKGQDPWIDAGAKGYGKTDMDEWGDSSIKGCGKIGKDQWMDSSGKGYGKWDFGYGWKGYGKADYEGEGFDGDSGKGYGKGKGLDSWGKGNDSWMWEGGTSAPPRAMGAYQPKPPSYPPPRAGPFATTAKAGGRPQDRSRTPPPLKGSLALGLQPPKAKAWSYVMVGKSSVEAKARPAGPAPPSSAPLPPVQQTAEGGPAEIDFSVIDAEIAAAAHAASVGESN